MAKMDLFSFSRTCIILATLASCRHGRRGYVAQRVVMLLSVLVPWTEVADQGRVSERTLYHRGKS